MKKTLALVIAILFVSPSLVFGVYTKEEYDCSEWAKAEIKKAELSYIAGESILENFTKEVTRSEFCKLAVSTYMALGKKAPTDIKSPFTDVNSQNVSVAYSVGIVKGVSETKFMPSKPITREEMAIMMCRLAKIIGCDETLTDIKKFADFEQVSEWALTDMEFMVGTGIIKGDTNNKLSPGEYTSREEAIVMIWRLYEYLGGEPVVLWEETSNEILAKLNIIDEKKRNSDSPVSTYDFFVALEKARGWYSDKTGDISDWYIGDTLSDLDYLEDSKKSLLLSLCLYGRNVILDYYEIPQLNLEEEITNSEALLYILRMVGDTYGCTDSVLDYYNADIEKSELYDIAYKKGLIEAESTDKAENYITYKELCDILHKALFVEYYSGGYAGVCTERLYDILLEEEKRKTTESIKKTPEKKKIEIPVVANINEDLSVEWILPENYNFITEEKYSTTIGTINLGSVITEIASIDMIEYLIKNMNFDKTSIRCVYSKIGTDTEYYFDIDISNIKLVVEGEEIKPGKYICYNSSWCAKEITLVDSQTFEKDCYYILKDYEKTYRKAEYNKVAYECFIADSSDNTFIAPTDRSFGVSFLDEIHIQKIKVSGNTVKGFVLSVTPESSEVFKIEESTERKTNSRL